MTVADVERAFYEFLCSRGLTPADETPIVGDGKRRRYRVDGDPSHRKNGWYVLYADDRPNGVAGSWRFPGKHAWSFKGARSVATPEDRKKWKEKRDAEAKKQAALHDRAAKRADYIWAKCVPAERTALYAELKRITPYMARRNDQALIIPVRATDGRLTSLQFIAGDGAKIFLPGGRVEGCYASVYSGTPDPDAPLLICEGYATACTLHEITGFPVVVAFNAGNLVPVAAAIRAKYPQRKLLICSDNDRATTAPIENPGLHFARKAASAASCPISIPEFSGADSSGTDFNDLALEEGPERVREIIENSLDPAPTEVGIYEEPPPHPGDARDQSRGMPYIDWPIRKKNGAPVCNIENVKALLDQQEITAKYNIISKDLDIRIPGETYLVDTQRNDKMTRIVSIANTAGLPGDKVKGFVRYIAGQCPFNPVATWIGSKEWDGKSRIQEFYDTVKGKHDVEPKMRAFKETLIKRWMISAVAVAFLPEPTSTAGVLTFTGVQGGGKTHWFKKLAPKELGLTKDGMMLRVDNKDSVMQATSYWLVELGELDSTFKRSEISQLKAFLTNSSDVLRPPYAEASNTYPRRTVFFGSVNDRDFLADPTGNRRFWAIAVDSLDYAHGLDMQQVWAEFHSMWKAGEDYFLNAVELAQLNAGNKEFEARHPIEDLVRTEYNWDLPWDTSYWEEKTPTQVVRELGCRTPTQVEVRAAGKALRDMTGTEPTAKRHGSFFRIPPLRGTARGQALTHLTRYDPSL